MKNVREYKSITVQIPANQKEVNKILTYVDLIRYVTHFQKLTRESFTPLWNPFKIL